MNCKSFSDFPRWKGVMENILDKYQGKPGTGADHSVRTGGVGVLSVAE